MRVICERRKEGTRKKRYEERGERETKRNREKEREIYAIIIVTLNSDASADLVDLREKKRLKVQRNGNINATILTLDINRETCVKRICLPGIFH